MPRPKQPLISRHAAVQAALGIIDAEGYETFSLEKLARHMNVRTPSLYHHFASKADLLTEASRTLLADIPLGADPPAHEWQEWFVDLCVGTYRRIMDHPRAAGLLFAYFPNSAVMPSHERGARILADLELPAPVRITVMRGLEKLVFGIAFADADDIANDRELLPTGVDRSGWPYLVEAVEASRVTREQMLETAVRLYLTGVDQVYLKAATPSPKSSGSVSATP